MKYYKETNDCKCIWRERKTKDNDKFIGAEKTDFQVSFVIDATGSMHTEIVKAKETVKKLIDFKHLTTKKLRVCFYRDHCDPKDIWTNAFPAGKKFTTDLDSIHKWIDGGSKEVRADGGGDYPEAGLDGLYHEIEASGWHTSDLEFERLIVHIYDAVPHGYWVAGK